LHSQEIKKPLPFTRSLAEFSRNRSQKDVTAAGTEQGATVPSTASASAIVTTSVSSPISTQFTKGI